MDKIIGFLLEFFLHINELLLFMAEDLFHVLKIEFFVNYGDLGGRFTLLKHFGFNFEECIFFKESGNLDSEETVLDLHLNFITLALKLINDF